MANLVLRKIGIVDTTGHVGIKRLKEIAAAIQIQIVRDIAPQWGFQAVVNAYSYVSEIPADFWPVTIVNSIPNRTGINGTHDFTGTGENRKPYAMVIYKNWTDFDFTESRFEKVLDEEIIEMCNNPFLENRREGPDPEDSSKTVTYLVELGDPGNRLDIGYYINDVFVTDFIYPSYFNAVHVTGTKYDHLGLIERPYSIVDGGYQIFQRVGQWYNALKVKGKMYFIKQGESLPADIATDNTTLYWIVGILYGLIILAFIIKRFIFNNKK